MQQKATEGNISSSRTNGLQMIDSDLNHWEVKHVGPGSMFLMHLHESQFVSGHSKYFAIFHEGKWKCRRCAAEAPEEIALVAELMCCDKEPWKIVDAVRDWAIKAMCDRMLKD